MSSIPRELPTARITASVARQMKHAVARQEQHQVVTRGAQCTCPNSALLQKCPSNGRPAVPFYYVIYRSRHNPKILGVDDAEIVGDRITEVRPIPRNFFTQETERRIGKLGASCVALVVRDMLVHHAP